MLIRLIQNLLPQQLVHLCRRHHRREVSLTRQQAVFPNLPRGNQTSRSREWGHSAPGSSGWDKRAADRNVAWQSAREAGPEKTIIVNEIKNTLIDNIAKNRT